MQLGNTLRSLFIIIALTAIGVFLGFVGMNEKTVEDASKPIEGTVKSYTINDMGDGNFEIVPQVEYEIDKKVWLSDAPTIPITVEEVNSKKDPVENIKGKNPFPDNNKDYKLTVHYLPDNPGVLVNMENKPSTLYFIGAIGFISLAALISGICFFVSSRKYI